MSHPTSARPAPQPGFNIHTQLTGTTSYPRWCADLHEQLRHYAAMIANVDSITRQSTLDPTFFKTSFRLDWNRCQIRDGTQPPIHMQPRVRC